MERSTVTIKGQVVIPSGIRKKYGIKSGTKVYFLGQEGIIKIIPVTSEVIEANFGFLKTNGKLLKALMEEKKREREL
ncbi:MAG: AbrB/MazE/SpoVT family DNA-binding domain-containing protein [Bacteroidota bacterium]|nr:AbrB/MazE/SpoVT family DNA-binding domain-containing protein [Bacteroidota bacterium]